MTKFELYDDTVIYTDGTNGAWLHQDTGKWHPFCYFYSGKLDIGDEQLDTPLGAYKQAKETYT